MVVHPNRRKSVLVVEGPRKWRTHFRIRRTFDPAPLPAGLEAYPPNCTWTSTEGIALRGSVDTRQKRVP